MGWHCHAYRHSLAVLMASNLNLRVLIKTVADLTQLGGLMKMLRGLSRPAKALGLVLRSVGADLLKMGMGAAAGITALSAGLWTMVRRTADAGDAALLAAQKTGVQIEAYQRLAYAAKMSAVEAEALDTSLKFLNVSVDAAGRGSKQDAQAFRDLGISLRDANGNLKPTESLLIEVADRFKDLESVPRKTAIAMALFGRSGVDMIPMLNEGGAAIRQWGEEAQAAGLVMSLQAAKDADEFNDGLDRLKGAALGLGMSLTGGLLPHLTELIEKARAFIAANKPQIIAQMTSAITQFAASMPAVLQGLSSIIKLIADISGVVGPVVGALGGFQKVLDLLATLMVGRLAIAIWTSVKAVWALNGAMYANPIGIVIIAIGGLIVAGWMLYRNWGKIVSWVKKAWGGLVNFFGDLGGKMKSAFKLAIDALWHIIPPWLRMIFRGAKFVLNVARNNLGQPPDGQAEASRRRSIAPTPAIPSRNSAINNGGTLIIDGRNMPRGVQLRATPADPRSRWEVNYRGGGVD